MRRTPAHAVMRTLAMLAPLLLAAACASQPGGGGGGGPVATQSRPAAPAASSAGARCEPGTAGCERPRATAPGGFNPLDTGSGDTGAGGGGY